MKIRITESQYNILVNKPRDVVFGRINEEIRPKYSKYSPEEEDEEIERIKNHVRTGGSFIRNADKDENFKWLIYRTVKDEKFQNALDDIRKIQDELEDKEIERIKNHVRTGGEFKRRSDNGYYEWLRDRSRTKKKFKDALDDIRKIQDELEDEEIERIKNHVRTGGSFIRNADKDENFKWLNNRSRAKEKFRIVLDDIRKIQDELGIKREWWGEKTIKDILEVMEFTNVTHRHKYKECKNSLTCRQYEFDIYLPYNENNVKINKNIPENGIIFEYDGIQHFEFKPHFHKTEENFISQIHRDKEKNLFCKNHKPNPIKLVRIPYTSKTKVDIKLDINLALNNPNTFILTGDYPKAGWNK
jgi:uncharacterized protein YjgD (DUF1641 family)